MIITDLTLNQGESGVLEFELENSADGAYIEWSVWIRPGRDVLFKDNGDVGGVVVNGQHVEVSITSDESATLDPINYNHEMWVTQDADRALGTTGTLKVKRRNVVGDSDIFTQASDIQAHLGITNDIPTALLAQCDVWVHIKMKAVGLGDIPTSQATDEMKLAGALIGCSYYVRSKESDTSWYQSVSIAGANVSRSQIAASWEASALDILKAMAEHIDPQFTAVTYNDQNFEYS